MSSTYYSGVRAALVETTTGFGYVLFAQTCESNCFPPQIRWSARTAGTLEEVSRWIASHLEQVDDGLVRGADGHPMKAESWLSMWHYALRDAVPVEAACDIAFGDGHYANPAMLREAFDRLCAKYGVQAAIRDANTVSLRPDSPAAGSVLMDFMGARYDSGQGDTQPITVYPWRIFRHVPAVPGTPLPPVLAGGQVPVLTASQAEQEATAAHEFLAQHQLRKEPSASGWNRWLVFKGDVLVCEATYDPLSWFSRDYLTVCNARLAGAAEPALKAYRAWATRQKAAADTEVAAAA